jgi:chemotaxis protein MotB
MFRPASPRRRGLPGPEPLRPWPSFVDALSASLLVLVFIITLLSIRSGKVLETMQKAKATDQVQQMITETVEKVVRSEGVTVTRLDERLRIMVPDTLLFSSGSAQISEAGQGIILAVARRLADIAGPVEVQGHTDDRPIKGKLSGRFPTNWELSTARATAVVRLMEEQGGIDSSRLSGAGLSMHRPIASNDTEAGRSRNRRIEIVVTPEAGDEQ